ncbi:MAG: zinc-dependent peptidase [Oleiphilaceae bacterium]|nr:zinc-dependent peptidase [Oleiphilaceae bacterium]
MSSAIAFAIFALAFITLAIFYLFFYPDWRRQRTLGQPFPERWRTLLHSQVPLYSALPAELRHQLEQHVQLFLAEKDFYGCDGLELDDRIRLTIAGHACLLILARSWSEYDEIRSVLVYPALYRVRGHENDGLLVHLSDEIRAGEASSLGQVVLAWSECEQAVNSPDGPHNVILHEFAHQLDYLDGLADGAPPLDRAQASHWQQTMSRAYEHLQHSLHRQRHSWLDPYGATAPAEFFAVLTEAFFQQPQHLYREQPDVYEALKAFYRLDPAAYPRAARTACSFL